MFKTLKLFHKYYLSPRPETYPVKQIDFEMHLEDFDFGQYKKDIFAFQDEFIISVADTIAYKGGTFEIFSIDIKNENATKQLLVFATVHGNEFVTALVIPKLLADISANKEYYKDWNIRIIAPVNPVGLKYQSRYNENGYDINRDFKNFETPQARLQQDEVEAFKPDLVLSLHEHPYDGFMIICTSKVPKDLQNAILADLKKNNIRLWKDHFHFKLPGTRAGLIREGLFINSIKSIFGIRTFGRYAMNKNIGVITSESPWKEKSIKKRILGHMICLRGIIEHY